MSGNHSYLTLANDDPGSQIDMIFFWQRYKKDGGECPAVPSKHSVAVAYNKNYPSIFTMEHGNRHQLNDFVQRKYGGTKEVEWDESKSGPEHRPVWEYKAKLDGYEIGHGQGLSKGAAKEAAAARALAYLRSREG